MTNLFFLERTKTDHGKRISLELCAFRCTGNTGDAIDRKMGTGILAANNLGTHNKSSAA